MSIQISGRNVTRNYESIDVNIFQLKEALSKADNFKRFLADNVLTMYRQLKSDYDNKFITEDQWMFYMKKIKEFLEEVNQPISMKLFPEIAEACKKYGIN